MKDYHEQNYYELLDVKRDANQDDILNAYKKARATYGANSPALYSLFDKSEAEELLRLIDEAYAVLSNQFKRKEYDKVHQKPGESVGINQENSAVVPHHQKYNSLSATEEQREFEKAFTPIQGVRGVLIKNSPAAKNPPGMSKFGKYNFDEAFEKEIETAEAFSGPYLQKIRLYKNITLDQICEVTKISRAYLNAIEANDYTCLPAMVFLRGFLIQLAKALDLDTMKVTNSYLKIMGEGKAK